MAKRWWRIIAAIEADSPSDAVRTLRRVGTMPETVQEITGDLGESRLDGVSEIPSPWHLRDTAPRDGSKFIGYDARIGHAETVFWDKDKNGFVDLDRKPTDFTQWIERPLVPEDDT